MQFKKVFNRKGRMEGWAGREEKLIAAILLGNHRRQRRPRSVQIAVCEDTELLLSWKGQGWEDLGQLRTG